MQNMIEVTSEGKSYFFGVSYSSVMGWYATEHNSRVKVGQKAKVITEGHLTRDAAVQAAQNLYSNPSGAVLT